MWLDYYKNKTYISFFRKGPGFPGFFYFAGNCRLDGLSLIRYNEKNKILQKEMEK